MSLDPKTGAVSVSGHGVSFTDSGEMTKLAKGWAHDPIEGLELLIHGKTETAPVEARPVKVSFAGTKRLVSLGGAALSASVTFEAGEPTLELEVSTEVKLGHGVTVTYAVTTTYHYDLSDDGPRLKREDVIQTLFAAAAAGAGASLLRGGASEPELVPAYQP